MAEEKKRKVTLRIAHSWEEAERLDDDWWEQFTPDEKVAMVWGLTLDYLAMKGVTDEPRLQRSFCRIKRPRCAVSGGGGARRRISQ